MIREYYHSQSVFFYLYLLEFLTQNHPTYHLLGQYTKSPSIRDFVFMLHHGTFVLII